MHIASPVHDKQLFVQGVHLPFYKNVPGEQTEHIYPVQFVQLDTGHSVVTGKFDTQVKF